MTETSAVAVAGERTAIVPWMRVSAALFAVAWGGNEFTPLLVMYRQIDQMSAFTVNVLLGAYVLGIVPALLLGGPLSDRYGRRPLFVPAPLIAIAGSALLAFGSGSIGMLFAGRVLSGIALGLVMAVGTSWVKELSEPPFTTRSVDGRGASRAALALTSGFALGAGFAAALGQFGPIPTASPYLLHILITFAAFLLLWSAPESRPRREDAGALWADLRIPAAMHRRFLLVVVPMAPWVFGTAASAYAILPGLMMAQAPGLQIGMSGLLCVVALGCGVAVQRFAAKIDDPRSARGIGVALAVTVPSMALAAVAVELNSLVWAFIAAAALGASYGMLLVGGLREIQRIAGPRDLAGLTAVYYSLTYLGFFIPAILAALGAWIPYTTMFLAGAALAALSVGVVALSWRRHLPTA
ncbi:MFS transporter [Microbacterium dextranolyticum]|uniref:Major facilitator family transporter n=1 Tax=Microbacterium dextranolyticum TaxID=36806 RepID=A0A9W6HLU8_9MICO|nr:MFS transporter [Microbacterium dextranolyticum]MBM7464016.1 MFS family permease [Microbacterium dextranolyticum]GLJ95096.1 major facilitator family transporter [Microbacterium dextranolyticum]